MADTHDSRTAPERITHQQPAPEDSTRRQSRHIGPHDMDTRRDMATSRPAYIGTAYPERIVLHGQITGSTHRNLTSSQWACIAVEAEEIVDKIKEGAKERRIAPLKKGNEKPDMEFIPERENIFTANSKEHTRKGLNNSA